MRASWRFACRLALLFGLLGPAAVAARNHLQDTLKGEHLLAGATLTEADCTALPEAVWVVVDDRGDCIRYFSGNVATTANPTVFVWFHGDRLRRNFKGGFFNTTSHEILAYRDNRPALLRSRMAAWASEHGVPALFVGRPGVYGSSGDHKLRRQEREVRLISAALDAIKKRHRIESLVLGGQSGGGHIVASLLALRADIRCAVLSSAPAAVQARIDLKGWPADATGLRKFFDPIAYVGRIPRAPARRIFVVGDPRDSNVPFLSQERYFEAVRAKGHEAVLIRARASEATSFHGLDQWAQRIAGWCAQGLGSDEIVRRVTTDSR